MIRHIGVRFRIYGRIFNIFMEQPRNLIYKY